MSSLKYTRDHEWIRVTDGIATVGISEYAQAQLGDVVYVELPDVGKIVGQADEAAVVESVKAASEVYAPVSGEITEVNVSLEDDPSLVNQSATDQGWFIRLKLDDLSQLDGLMDEATYAKYVDSLNDE